MKITRVLTALGLTVALAIATDASAQVTLYDFEANSDLDILGDGATLDAGEVLTTFGFPIGNQSAPQETAVRARTASPITLSGGTVSARFTADWSLDGASPFFAGIQLVNAQTDLSLFSQGTIDLRTDFPGVSTVGMLISDGTNDYEHLGLTTLAGDNTYTFDFTNPSNWVRTSLDPSFSYSDVLGNAQFIGFTLLRSGATTDIETITFDNVVLVPEPSSILLMAVGAVVLAAKPNRKRNTI